MNNIHRSVLKQAVNLRSTTKSLLQALLTYLHGDKTECYPSIQDISDLTGFSRRTIQTHLRILERLGYILTVRQNNRKSNLYKMICVCSVQDVQRTERAQSIPLEAENTTCENVDLTLALQINPSPAKVELEQSKPPTPENPSPAKVELEQSKPPTPENPSPAKVESVKPWSSSPTMDNWKRVMALKAEEEAREEAERAKREAQEAENKPKAQENPAVKQGEPRKEAENKPKAQEKPTVKQADMKLQPVQKHVKNETQPPNGEPKKTYNPKKLVFTGDWNKIEKVVEIWEIFTANDWVANAENEFMNFLSTFASIARKAKLPDSNKNKVKNFYGYLVKVFKDGLNKQIIRRKDEDKAIAVKKELFKHNLYPVF